MLFYLFIYLSTFNSTLMAYIYVIAHEWNRWISE